MSFIPEIKRRVSRQIHVGDVAVGGDAPVSVQSMTNTETCDVEARCPMRGQWNKVNLAIKQALDRVSLEEIAVTCMPAPTPHEEALDALEQAFEDLERAN